MSALVAGLAQKGTVAEFIVAPGRERFLVMELLGGETAVAVVGTPTGGALAGPASSLSSQTLNLFGKTHVPSFVIPCTS